MMERLSILHLRAREQSQTRYMVSGSLCLASFIIIIIIILTIVIIIKALFKALFSMMQYPPGLLNGKIWIEQCIKEWTCTLYGRTDKQPVFLEIQRICFTRFKGRCSKNEFAIEH